MIGQTISHYRIVSQLGVGGMGVVYAADDPRLNRQVALKFVPDDLAHDTHALERLRSEARAAASLTHPNICTIYDIGEHNGRPFIVMELLKGTTLRDRLIARRMKIHEAVDVGIHVSEALLWAHSKGLIHRDIKPANLFLVDQGPLKVLDFGLAKITTPFQGTDVTIAPTIDLTAVGVAVGTVDYMSPEQVSGETLDGRTDLFSLGVVLYECVTAQQPFKGKTAAVVLANILTQAPTAPMALNAEVPERLQEVINNCLEKDRELRYQDAAGLRTDLRRIKRDIESGALKMARASSGPVVVPESSMAKTAVVPLTATATPPPPSASIATEPQAALSSAAAPARKSSGLMIGVGAAVLVAGGVAVAIMMKGGGTPAPATEQAATTPPAATTATIAAAAPGPADQTRARFDTAILETNRLLAAGDADGATRALNEARSIDPDSPAVRDLSVRLVDQFRTQADARRTPESSAPAAPAQRPQQMQQAQPARRTPGAFSETRPANAGSAAATRPANAEPSTSAPSAQSPAPPAMTAAVQVPAAPAAPAPPSAPSPQPQAAEPALPQTSPAPVVRNDPPPARPEPAPERRPQPAAAVEEDDAVIRRVVASYARAIESKDIGLFRSLKPNMTSDEQRRIEDGFRAVASQRVSISIQSIDHRGTDATVRVQRRDVIQAGGRQQSVDSQQTLTMVKNGTNWVIAAIAR